MGFQTVNLGDIDVREGSGRGLWKRASDYHIKQVMYKSIREAFSRAVEAVQSLQAIFGEKRPVPENVGSSHSARGSFDSAQVSSDSAQPTGDKYDEGTPPLPF